MWATPKSLLFYHSVAENGVADTDLVNCGPGNYRNYCNIFVALQINQVRRRNSIRREPDP